MWWDGWCRCPLESHTLDFAALIHAAMCWQRQAACYMCDLQVSREMSEQRRALQPSACEHTMCHAFVSSREICFVTRMEKGAVAFCTAYFSLVHIVLGIYSVTWCSIARHSRASFRAHGDRGSWHGQQCQHPSAKPLPSAQPT